MAMNRRLRPGSRWQNFWFYNQNWEHQTLMSTPDQVYYEFIKLPNEGRLMLGKITPKTPVQKLGSTSFF